MKKLAWLAVLAVIVVNATGCVVSTRPVARPVVVHPHRTVVVVR